MTNVVDIGRDDAPVIGLPERDRIREASMSGNPNAPQNLAEAHADRCMRSYIMYQEQKLADANQEVAETRQRLNVVVANRAGCQSYQDFPDELPRERRGQPKLQIKYNYLKCFFALLAPIMGGAYLMANMMDHSFSLASKPLLAVLASGPIVLASFAFSSWAILPTDVREVERRSAILLVLSAFAFVAWAASISLRFGTLPPSSDQLGFGFDPTAAPDLFGDAIGNLISWIEVNGVSVGALFLHLLAEALLSAGCISSAICSARKVLPVHTEQTSHDKLLEEQENQLRKHLDDAQARALKATRMLGKFNADRQIVRDTTEQAVLAAIADLNAQQDQAVAKVRMKYST